MLGRQHQGRTAEQNPCDGEGGAAIRRRGLVTPLSFPFDRNHFGAVARRTFKDAICRLVTQSGVTASRCIVRPHMHGRFSSDRSVRFFGPSGPLSLTTTPSMNWRFLSNFMSDCVLRFGSRPTSIWPLISPDITPISSCSAPSVARTSGGEGCCPRFLAAAEQHRDRHAESGSDTAEPSSSTRRHATS
jgi:hypothetical protein